MNKILYFRILAGLISIAMVSMWSGCGKESEEASSTENSQVFTQPKETSSSEETESEDTSAIEKETKNTKAKTTETASPSEESSETVAEDSSATETGTAQASNNTSQNAENSAEDSPQEVTVIEAVEQQVQDEQVYYEEEGNAQVSTQPETEASTEALATMEIEPSALTVSYAGQTLTIGESAEAFVNAVKPDFEESAPSCYGNGENINYYYDDITIYVWNENGNYLTYSIDINAAGIAAIDNYDIGMEVDFDNEKIIDCGDGYTIVLLAIDNKIISISYNKDL